MITNRGDTETRPDLRDIAASYADAIFLVACDGAFNEIDLRSMLEYASGHRSDILEGRSSSTSGMPDVLGRSSWSRTKFASSSW